MVVDVGPVGEEERGFLEQIVAEPRELQNRLVYADWLTERGSAHGELIALQCTVDRMLPDYLQDAGDLDRRRKMEARERELIAELDLPSWLTSAFRQAKPLTVERGFVKDVGFRCQASAFGQAKHALERLAPFATSLEVTQLDNADDLVSGGRLNRFESIVVEGQLIRSPLTAFADASFDRARTIELENISVGTDGLVPILAAKMPVLERLSLATCELSVGSVDLIRRLAPPTLRSLNLLGNLVDATELRRLVDERSLEQLTVDVRCVDHSEADFLRSRVGNLVVHNVMIHRIG